MIVEITRVLKWTQVVPEKDYTDLDTGQEMTQDEIRTWETDLDMESVIENLTYQDEIDMVTQVAFKED